MKCINHPEVDAIGVCNRCGKYICEACKVPSGGEIYCKQCIAEKAGSEQKQKKSPILAAILSFCLGGLGQVYNGQPGKGLLIFFTSIFIIPWIYGIFDAYNTANKINSGIIIVPQKPGCIITAMAFMIITPFFLAILGLLAAIAIPNFVAARANAQAGLCRNNLKLIICVKEQYAVENNLTDGSIIPETDNNGVDDGDGIPDALEKYFKVSPLCPSGGKYNIGPVGKKPTCSFGDKHTIKEYSE